jgi:uncharacterized protein YxjI
MVGGRRQERREERREDRGPGGGGGSNRYQMRQRMLSIGDDYFIDNDRGERAFKVDGKALRVRKILAFEDMAGNEICRIQEKMLNVKEAMEIEGPEGERLAMVKKALISPLRDRWVVKLGDGPDLEVKGNVVDHDYKIESGRDKIAEVSKKWFRVRDTYGIEVEPGQNDALIIAVAIDTMAHPAQ